jgi:hypothetical protein
VWDWKERKITGKDNIITEDIKEKTPISSVTS